MSASILLAAASVVAFVGEPAPGVPATVARGLPATWTAAFAQAPACRAFKTRALDDTARALIATCVDDRDCLLEGADEPAVLVLAHVWLERGRLVVAGKTLRREPTAPSLALEGSAPLKAGLRDPLTAIAARVCGSLSPPPAASLDIGLDDADAPAPAPVVVLAPPAPAPEPAVDMPPPPLPPVDPLPPAVVAVPTRSPSPAPYVLAGVSALGAVVGALLGRATLEAAAERDLATDGATWRTQQARAESNALYANVSWSLAATSAVVAGVWWLASEPASP